MDKIFIKDLRVDTFIGIYDWEQQVRQTLSLDIDIATSLNTAGLSNELTDTIDYARLASAVTQLIQNTSWHLLERLAEETAQFILEKFNAPSVKIRVTKIGAVPNSQAVGIEILRRAPST